MVGGSDLVVSIGFNALDSIVIIKRVVVQHDLVNCIYDWHLLLSWKQTSVLPGILH